MAVPLHFRTRFLQLSGVLFTLLSTNSLHASSDPLLRLDYYASSCPTTLDIIRREMECAVASNPRNAALILRLHFHDCFVQGCDGSVLLDDTITLQGEKEASPNKNSLKGYELIDIIKNKLESECPGIVSCADTLTIAARDATILVGGPYWDVPLGRKDSRAASYELANVNIPTPEDGLLSIIPKFLYQGLSVTDMVALSGAHTIGMARCESFRERIYGDFSSSTIKKYPFPETYLSNLKANCPPNNNGIGDNKMTAMDYVTPNRFDNSFYNLLLKDEGLLSSDQDLYSSRLGFQTKGLVKKYAIDEIAFFEQFSESMVKLGNILNSDSFISGEVRKNCKFLNSEQVIG